MSRNTGWLARRQAVVKKRRDQWLKPNLQRGEELMVIEGIDAVATADSRSNLDLIWPGAFLVLLFVSNLVHGVVRGAPADESTAVLRRGHGPPAPSPTVEFLEGSASRGPRAPSPEGRHPGSLQSLQAGVELPPENDHRHRRAFAAAEDDPAVPSKPAGSEQRGGRRE